MTSDRGFRSARKDDHLRLALSSPAAAAMNGFDDVEFIHHALPGVGTDAIDVATRIAGRSWPVPLFITGMTGGTPRTDAVNRELAIAANETGVPLATGSMSIALDDPDAAAGFRDIRRENPHGVVLANLGADRTPDDAKRAVELVQADALQLHLNAVQETVMPEGARDFSHWERSIAAIVATSPVPVIVKEVGFGLSRRTITQLQGIGVAHADVGGRGGTDFVAIERSRRTDDAYGWLNGFGQTTVECLLDAPSGLVSLIASGGVRHPLDVLRALALGADAVGVAGAFLRVVTEGGAGALVPVLRSWDTQIRSALALLGAPDIDALRDTDLLIRGRTREFCDLRGIDARRYAFRTRAAHPGGDR